MTIEELYDNVVADPDIEGVGTDEHGAVALRHTPTGRAWSMPLRTALATPWPQLRAILAGEQSPHTLQSVTRVCGYYSRVANWNPSKVAELADRRKGDYRVQ